MTETDTTKTRSTALTTARAYYDAWTSYDFDRAMTFLAEDLLAHTPAGRLAGAEAFRAFMEPFTQSVTRTELIAAFGDERTALLMYDTATHPVPSAPGAECLTVVDGRITELRIIFDNAPFSAARQATETG